MSNILIIDKSNELIAMLYFNKYCYHKYKILLLSLPDSYCNICTGNSIVCMVTGNH